MLRCFLVQAFLYLSLFSCGGTLGGNPEREIIRANEPSGSISISLSSTSVDYAKSVFVTIEGIEISARDDIWIKPDSNITKEYDLLNLGDQKKVLLGNFSGIKSEKYQKIRIHFSATKPARLIEDNDSAHPLPLADDLVSAFIITTQIDLIPQTDVDYMLELDLNRSIIINQQLPQKYSFRPQLEGFDTKLTGALVGTVSASHTICVYQDKTMPDGDPSCPNAKVSTTLKSGTFRISSLTEGNYLVRIFKNKIKVKDLAPISIKPGVTTDLGDLSAQSDNEDSDDDD